MSHHADQGHSPAGGNRSIGYRNGGAAVSNRTFRRKFGTWEPKNAVLANIILYQSAQEPTPPRLSLKINGMAIEIPRYNGIDWWFPETTQHPVEDFFCTLFTVVHTMQTASICVWITVLVYHLGWLFVPTLVLTVPLAAHLNDLYGANHGTAYSSLNALRLGVYLIKALLHVSQQRRQMLGNDDEDENSQRPPLSLANHLIAAFLFVVAVFSIGIILSHVEKYVLGRTWNAAFAAYGELAFWIYSGWRFVYP